MLLNTRTLSSFQAECLVRSALALDKGDEELAAALHRIANIQPCQRIMIGSIFQDKHKTRWRVIETTATHCMIETIHTPKNTQRVKHKTLEAKYEQLN